ncbi:MAG: PHP domain-containing protein [Clostridia bacterium]|nr:PHP domain-containing protein [Clostridia bacterium]
MPRAFAADLHVHTFLSPCASREMSPGSIVRRCREVGIDVVAITDHNTGGNVARAIAEANAEAAAEAAAADVNANPCRSVLTVIAGMEVSTVEDVHLLVLLPSLAALGEWEREVAIARAPGVNVREIFGEQWVQDAATGEIREEHALLAAPTRLSVDDVAFRAAELGGICLPAHVDRPSFSILGQLGFIPEHLDIPAVEISRNTCGTQAFAHIPAIVGRTLVCSSDAHSLDEIGLGSSLIWAEAPTASEIIMALRGVGGRRVEVL